MRAMYGKKLGMTRIFNDEGDSVPVTVLELAPNVVMQVKTKDKEGYEAVQVGYGSQKPQRIGRALAGHMAKAKKGTPRYLAEIRLDKPGQEIEEKYELGQALNMAEMFPVGTVVDVVGQSIGKGFAGVLKRHHMAGFPGSRGTHEYFRHGGSIGCRKFPGRVFKNKRMSGHMGDERVMQEGLTVVRQNPEENLLFVRGSVPGPKNGFIFIRQSVKQG